MNRNTSIIDKILNNRLLTHLIFWVVILVFYSQVFLYASGYSLKAILVSTSAILPSILMASYFLTYYQLPKLLYKQKYSRFLLSILASFYIYTLLARTLTIYVAEPFLESIDKRPSLDYFFTILLDVKRLLQSYLLPVYLAPFIMAIIKLLKQRSQDRSKLDQLEKEKVISELNFLKTQIHPHFLLNTLNNIYALTLKKSEQASGSILKLSEMLTYVLYQCNEKYVSLEQEIQLLENYISLEALRYGKELTLNFEKSIQSTNTRIAPLILLSLVENAFKHGASNAVEAPIIRIYLKETNDNLTFSVYNTKNNSDTLNRKGIGGINLRKQLDILYTNNYTYTIDETDSTYKVTLQINLKKEIDEY